MPEVSVEVKDDGLDGWDAARTDDLVRGVREKRDVVLTNGPFLRVTANGAGIGGIAGATRPGGLVDVKVHVTSAPFAAVDRAELRLAGGGAKLESKPVVVLVPKKSASGAMEGTKHDKTSDCRRNGMRDAGSRGRGLHQSL